MGVLDFFRRTPKAEAPPPKRERQPTAAIAMVALRRVELPDLMQLTERLRDWPCPLEPKIEKTDIVMMNAPGGWAACALMPVPIPWSDLEWPAQAAAWRWRDAETSLREHKAHLLLHVRSDELDAIDTWLLLTRLAAAVVSCTDAAGVYWGASSTVHKPAMFMEMARTASRDDLPLLIWIGFHPVRNEAGASVFTTGLDAFDLMDLEVRDSKHEPSVILERLLDLAAYCILTGRPLKDGDTVGHSDAERIPLKHVPSAFIPGRMVCRIVL